MHKNVISVLDGMTGSCGKAKVIGEIATDNRINLGAAITNNMPNAGHTFVDEKGKRVVFRNIPVSCVNPDTELFIGPGSAIDLDIFMEEYERVKPYIGDRKIYVHERVPIIEARHIEREKREVKTGSTFKGCGPVLQDKIIRDAKLKFFKSFKNAICTSNAEWLERLYEHLDNESEYVMVETSQGCGLSLNFSGNDPYTTSRNISTARFLDYSGIPASRLLGTIMVIRPFPIRISSITKSSGYVYSGGFGGGAPLTWTQVNLASMYKSYPFNGDVDCFDNNLSLELVRELVLKCPDKYLMQVFGPDYRSKCIEDITLLEALEVERLIYKSEGIKEYETRLLELPMISADFPPNTIIDQSEQTTVSLQERRIGDMDIEQLKLYIKMNDPYGLYLNFLQHLDYSMYEKSGAFEDYHFNKYLRTYFEFLESETKTKILALGTGAGNNQRILRHDLVRR